MSIQIDKAISSFKSGLNCAQSVLMAYSAQLNLDENFCLKLSSGFGGGMGRLQETCGAVTGSYMIIGIKATNIYPDANESREKTISMIREFTEKFKTIHKSTNCSKLLNCDLNTPEGQRYLSDNNLSEKVCIKCILDSIDIIEDIFNQSNN
jgi:C_GCAxxG_C_C family probable redox protein